MLEKGDSVPNITAKNQDGESVTLDFTKHTVVYFYPEDGTPGCTTEAKQFNMELDTYSEAGVGVYGVSTDDVDSHCDFAEEHGLGFDLLADPDGEIASVFDVDVSNGRAPRTTFVVSEGEIKAVYEGVKPDGHARRVLSDMLDSGLVALDI